MEIRRAFKALTDSKNEYVCLDGYQNSLIQQRQFKILTRDRDSLVRLLELKPRGRDTKFNPFFDFENLDVRPGDANRHNLFAIYEKGNNFLPEKFETELLTNRILYENCVYVPAQEHELWITIHALVTCEAVREVLTANEREVFNKAIAKRIGILPKSKYMTDPSRVDRLSPAGI